MRKILLITAMLSSLATTFAQTGLKLTYRDGSEQVFQVYSSGKLYFDSLQLHLVPSDTSSLTTIPIAIIRTLTFTSSLTPVKELFEEAGNQIVLYPNPGTDFLQIQSHRLEPVSVRIYSVNGQLAQYGQYLPAQPIDISRLEPGLYLVQVNQQVLKFIRK